MKILAVCPAIPAKNAKGYQVLAYHRLQYLTKKHDVFVICFGQRAANQDHIAALASIGIEVRMLPWRWIDAVFEIIKSLFNRDKSLQCSLFSSSVFKAAVDDVALEFEPDLIYATTIRVVPNVVDRVEPLVLDLVDSMALNFRRRIETAPWWKRPLWKFEHGRVARYEQAMAEKSMASFVVSSVDKEEIGSEKISVLPLGIDSEQFKMGAPAENPIIVFTGNMSYRPNIEAAVWFASECWPSINAAFPNSMFLIAGNRPSSSVLDLGKLKNVSVSGHVPDMAAVIRRAQVAIAPMRSGSGMQFKILEAMACGVPVVASSLGVGDIRAVPGSDLLIANTAGEFIESTLGLLSSFEARAQIGQSAHYFITKKHTWESLNFEFEGLLVGKMDECSILRHREIN